MKFLGKLLFSAFMAVVLMSFDAAPDKLVSKNGHINFFSHTVAEDISSDNYKVTSTLDTNTGEVVFSLPMQSFEFEKALMQKHFNSSKFLDTKKFPKAKFVGKVENIGDVDFGKDGTYAAQVVGELTIKEIGKQISEKGTIIVSGDKITVNSKFNVTLSDYQIAFEKGKPSTNVAEVIEVTVRTIYNQ
jgi:polyisoprenoid-binding protein YceI